MVRLVRRQDPCIVVNNPSLSHRLPARVDDEGEANIALQFCHFCPPQLVELCHRTHTNCYVVHVSDSVCCGLWTEGKRKRRRRRRTNRSKKRRDATLWNWKCGAQKCKDIRAGRRTRRQTGRQTYGADSGADCETGLRDCVDCGMDKSVLRLAASKPLSQLVVVSIPSGWRRCLKKGMPGMLKVGISLVRLQIEV